MPDYNIGKTAARYCSPGDIRLPAGMRLVSFDNGVVDVEMQSNGMRFAVLPFGKGNSAMVRRLCIGGSRLEDSEWAGSCHVIEHADFRTLNWLSFGGMNKNAATCKNYIEHQANLLLDPSVGHLQKELQFHVETMKGNNIRALDADSIRLEIQNVWDERNFNAQSGSAYRMMVMKCEEMLLPRVWGPLAWCKPTIGDRISLDHIRTADDLMLLHHMMRGSQRTNVVLAGAVDVNRTLQLFSDVFSGVQPADETVLRDLPPSLEPCNLGRVSANVTANAGTRYISIGGFRPAYSAYSDVAEVMQHLVGVLGSQPAVKQHGVECVSMYCNPEDHAGVYVIVAKVTKAGNEHAALTEAQHAIEEHIMAPLRMFSDGRVLSTLLGQYKAKVLDSLQGSPSTLAALGIKGILACGRPSLMFHVEDRFSEHNISCERVRAVANQMFDPSQLAIVRCTESQGSAPVADVARSHGANALSVLLRAAGLRLAAPALQRARFHTVPCLEHLQADSHGKNFTASARYMALSEATPINVVKLRDARQAHVATAAYNTVKVMPLHKKSLTIALGTQGTYGGWAQSLLAAQAMNAVSKVAAGGKCTFKVEQGRLTGTIDHSDNLRQNCGARGLFTRPLVSCFAMAAAIGGAVTEVPGLTQLKEQLPLVALREAALLVNKEYENPASVAQRQARSQSCSLLDPGYQPPDLRTALAMLQAEASYVVRSVGKLNDATPMLAGTNASCSELATTVSMLGAIAREARRVTSRLRAADLDKMHDTPAPAITMLQVMPGLQTYPYVASARAMRPLERADRALFIVASQVMAGGMGSVYTHNVRQRGVSYRPSGGSRLNWQTHPVILLHATFDSAKVRDGRGLTLGALKQWRTGDALAFSRENVDLAKQALKEQLDLSRMEFDALKYSLLADMDPDKYATHEIEAAVNAVTPGGIQQAMRRYFDGAEVKESWVALDNSVLGV